MLKFQAHNQLLEELIQDDIFFFFHIKSSQSKAWNKTYLLQWKTIILVNL